MEKVTKEIIQKLIHQNEIALLSTQTKLRVPNEQNAAYNNIPVKKIAQLLQ